MSFVSQNDILALFLETNKAFSAGSKHMEWKSPICPPCYKPYHAICKLQPDTFSCSKSLVGCQTLKVLPHSAVIQLSLQRCKDPPFTTSVVATWPSPIISSVQKFPLTHKVINLYSSSPPMSKLLQTGKTKPVELLPIMISFLLGSKCYHYVSQLNKSNYTCFTLWLKQLQHQYQNAHCCKAAL